MPNAEVKRVQSVGMGMVSEVASFGFGPHAPVAVVVNNNGPTIVELAPNVTLTLGTKLYLAPAS